MTLTPGSRIGKYTIRSRLGAGGMGEVYVARGPLGGKVAIKIIGRDKTTDRQFMRRFRLEAEAISRIHHPHIVKLFDFVEADAATNEPAYIVMELLEGQDLGAAIKAGPLSISRVVSRILECCAALTEVHRHGYIHRDVKPNNIFLAQYDQIEQVKLLDFGATKTFFEDARTDEGELSELTKKHAIFGTPFYMAPEQLRRGGRITAKIDQYALGVVLYTALTGVKPFVHNDKQSEAVLKDLQLFEAILNGSHIRPRERRPEIPEGLELVIEQMMHVDPDQRYADIHAAGGALRPWASSEIATLWEAHFTSSAPKRRPPQLSMAIPDPDTSPRRRLPDTTHVDATAPSHTPSHGLATMTTVRAAPSSQELAAAGDVHAKATVVQDLSAEAEPRPNATISIDIDEVSRIDEGSLSRSRSTPVTRPPARERRFGLVIAGIVITAGLAMGVAFYLSRHKPAQIAPPSPPPELFARPAAPAPVPAVPAPTPPPAALPSLPPNTAPVAEPAAPAASPAPVPSSQTHPAHRRRKAPVVDEHGIGIPSD